jgi:hypothetical protein
LAVTAVVSSLSELARFLLARVDDDDDQLRRMQRKHVQLIAADGDVNGIGSVARLRAECGAKRNIIGQAQHLLMLRDLPSEKVVRESAAQMLRALAEPYRDHYAYRSEWSPASH